MRFARRVRSRLLSGAIQSPATCRTDYTPPTHILQTPVPRFELVIDNLILQHKATINEYITTPLVSLQWLQDVVAHLPIPNTGAEKDEIVGRRRGEPS